jgi:uncharacterized peroxidase-related enzyme
MSRLPTPTRDAAPAASRPLLDDVLKKFGVVPNLFRVFALSPHALQGLLALDEANSKMFDLKTRERIAIGVAQANSCDYCLSAHTYIATNLARITAEDATLNRNGASTDAKASAAVRFAVTIAERRGGISDDDLAAVKAAGYSDAQIVEIVSLVAQNVLTNFLGRVARTEIDFPALHTSEAA